MPDNNNIDQRIEEYKALRAEILLWQGHRVRFLALAITAMAEFLALFGGILMKTPAIESSRIIPLAYIGAASMYFISIPLQSLIISAHRQIRRLGDYIRIHIEFSVPGLQYETLLEAIRADSKRASRGWRSLGWVCIALSIVPMTLPVFSALAFKDWSWTGFGALILMMLISLYFAFDLWFDFHQKGRSGWTEDQ